MAKFWARRKLSNNAVLCTLYKDAVGRKVLADVANSVVDIAPLHDAVIVLVLTPDVAFFLHINIRSSYYHELFQARCFK